MNKFKNFHLNIMQENLIFFDTETTGIIKNENKEIISNWDLIQIAYRKISDWKKQDKNLFFMTDTKIEVWAMAIHWIYPELLMKKSAWKYLTDDFREELSKVFLDWILIAHNIDFDKDVLQRAWIKMSDKQIDTLKVARVLKDEGVLKNNNWDLADFASLQYLRYFFELYEIKDENWNIECTTAHNAFWDVVVLEKVFYKLFELIKDKLNISDKEVLEKMIEMTKKEFIMVQNMRIWKYRGKTFKEVFEIDPNYLRWMLNTDLSEDLKYTAKVWLWLEKDKKFFS